MFERDARRAVEERGCLDPDMLGIVKLEPKVDEVAKRAITERRTNLKPPGKNFNRSSRIIVKRIPQINFFSNVVGIRRDNMSSDLSF